MTVSPCPHDQMIAAPQEPAAAICTVFDVPDSETPRQIGSLWQGSRWEGCDIAQVGSVGASGDGVIWSFVSRSPPRSSSANSLWPPIETPLMKTCGTVR